MRPIHALPVALVVAAVAGCGGGGDDSGGGGPGTTSAAAPAQTQSTTAANTLDGRTIFTTHTCDGCHTLKAADSIGNVGPNLDHLKLDFATVRRQVENGGKRMPSYRGELSAAQMDAVARFVSDNAGR
jgi:sulfite dehydrogenase